MSLNFIQYKILLISVVGIALLFWLFFDTPLRVYEINSLDAQTLVQVEGIVNKESFSGREHRFFVGDIEGRCYCAGSFKGKSIVAVGRVEKYGDKNYVRVYEINRAG